MRDQMCITFSLAQCVKLIAFPKTGKKHGGGGGGGYGKGGGNDKVVVEKSNKTIFPLNVQKIGGKFNL